MGKKSVQVYYDYIEHFEMLDDNQFRNIIYAMIRYDDTNEIIEMDKMTQLAFSFIKKRIDYDKGKYDKRCETSVLNGKLGGRPLKPNNLTKPNNNPSKPRKPDIDIDIELDIDNKENICSDVLDKKSVICKDVLNYLNEKLEKNYKNTDKHNNLIIARLNEKYTLNDFKTVIDNMISHWGNDEKMNRYLVPDTLFSNKFDKYLNMGLKKKTLKDIDLTMEFLERYR